MLITLIILSILQVFFCFFYNKYLFTEEKNIRFSLFLRLTDAYANVLLLWKWLRYLQRKIILNFVKTPLLWISKFNSQIFKFSSFYIWSILITHYIIRRLLCEVILLNHCTIFSRIITCVTNPYCPTPTDKPRFVYHPCPVFPNDILMWGVKPGRHLYTRMTFEIDYTYIQSPKLTCDFIK